MLKNTASQVSGTTWDFIFANYSRPGKEQRSVDDAFGLRQGQRLPAPGSHGRGEWRASSARLLGPQQPMLPSQALCMGSRLI